MKTKKKPHHHLASADKRLAKLIKKIGPPKLRVERTASPFRALVEAVVYQQLTGKAAETILGRFKKLFGEDVFPTPEQIIAIAHDKMRGAGLSGAKTLAIKDIAQKTIEGTVPETKAILKLDNDVIIEQLTQIRGVGRWTVEMLLIFKLGRKDVLPSSDYGVRKGFASVYGHKELPTPKELEAHGARWAPFRSFAAWYLWRAADLNKLEGKPAAGRPGKSKQPKTKRPVRT